MPLKCDATRDGWPLMPLYPGKYQEWIVSYRGTGEKTEDELEAWLLEIFQQWRHMFPGVIGVPELMDIGDAPAGSDVMPPQVERRAPRQTMGVRFAYGGTATSMPWPTLVHQRRARLPGTCPQEPIDVMPVAAGNTGESVSKADVMANQVPTPPRVDEIPWDAGLGSVDIEALKEKAAELKEALTPGLGTKIVLAGAGIALLVVWANRGKT